MHTSHATRVTRDSDVFFETLVTSLASNITRLCTSSTSLCTPSRSKSVGGSSSNRIARGTLREPSAEAQHVALLAALLKLSVDVAELAKQSVAAPPLHMRINGDGIGRGVRVGHPAGALRSGRGRV